MRIEDKNKNTVLYPLYKDPTFSQAKQLDDYRKLKELYETICLELDNLEDKLETHSRPKGPRQMADQMTDKNHIKVLTRRKERLESQMTAMEASIKRNVDSLNKKL
jgi:hypothetical protein